MSAQTLEVIDFKWPSIHDSRKLNDLVLDERLTGADSVLNGRALVQRDLIFSADRANRAAERRAQYRAVRRRRTFSADRVVSRGARTSRPVAVRAQLARPASENWHDVRGAVFVARVRRRVARFAYYGIRLVV